MRRVEAEIRIAAEPQTVWDLYADVLRSVEWVPFAEEILYVSGPPGLGQVYRERTRLAGLTDVAEWRIVEWEPPRRQVQMSVGKGAESRLIIEISSDERGGSLLRQAAEISSRLPRPVGSIHELVFARVARHGIVQAVAAAKRELEKR